MPHYQDDLLLAVQVYAVACEIRDWIAKLPQEALSGTVTTAQLMRDDLKPYRHDMENYRDFHKTLTLAVENNHEVRMNIAYSLQNLHREYV